MKVLVLDNYDSFTYNLTNQLKIVRPNYLFTVLRNRDPKILTTDFDVLVISPGPMTPDKTGLLHRLFEEKIIPQKVPVLGICLGMQFIGLYYNSTVEKSSQPIHGSTAEICHNGTGIFRNIKKSFKAARYNSLEIRAENIDKTKLTILALEKERDAVMALCHQELPLVGFQFHPESFLTEQGDKLINNFFCQYVEN